MARSGIIQAGDQLMATKPIDVKRGRVLLSAIESIQSCGGKFVRDSTMPSGEPAIKFDTNLNVMVEDPTERKKVMDALNAAINPIIEPLLARYHQEHRALVPSAIKKDV